MRSQTPEKYSRGNPRLYSPKKAGFQIVFGVGAVLFSLVLRADAAQLTRTVEKKPGQVRIIHFFEDDHEIAAEIFNGKKKTLTGNIADGVYKEYGEGRLKYEWPYVGGRPDGMAVEYYDGRRKKYETNYRQGYRHGSSKYYSSMGYLLRERTYQLDRLEGLVKEYYSTGELERETMYADDKKNGPAVEYNKGGLVRAEKIFKNDGLVSTKLYDKNGLPITRREGE